MFPPSVSRTIEPAGPAVYYQDDRVTLYHGDCREILPQLGKSSVCITDPPWKLLSERRVVLGNERAVALWREAAPLAAARVDRLLVWLPATADPREWLNPIPMPFLRSMMIRRAIPGYFGRVLLDVEEIFSLGTWPAPRRGRLVIPGGLQITYSAGDRPGWHPAPRSARATRWLVKFWSDPGDTILDPFAGSGTTLLAAKEMGRHAVGIEAEERYCEGIVRRCAQAELFPPESCRA